MRDQTVTPNLVAATRQGWKLTAASVGFVATAVAGLVQVLGPSSTTLPAFGAVLGLGLGSLAVTLSVRCPACRRSLGRWAIRTQTPGRWQGALAALDACPFCGAREPSPVSRPVA